LIADGLGCLSLSSVLGGPAACAPAPRTGRSLIAGGACGPGLVVDHVDRLDRVVRLYERRFEHGRRELGPPPGDPPSLLSLLSQISIYTAIVSIYIAIGRGVGDPPSLFFDLGWVSQRPGPLGPPGPPGPFLRKGTGDRNRSRILLASLARAEGPAYLDKHTAAPRLRSFWKCAAQ
jgi:hypothetical protein